MYDSVCKFGGEKGEWKKMAFIYGAGFAGLRVGDITVNVDHPATESKA
jgi:hypothetical protein